MTSDAALSGWNQIEDSKKEVPSECSQTVKAWERMINCLKPLCFEVACCVAINS